MRSPLAHAAVLGLSVLLLSGAAAAAQDDPRPGQPERARPARSGPAQERAPGPDRPERAPAPDRPERDGPEREAPPPGDPTPVRSMRFDASVHQVTVPRDKVAQLDVTALAGSAATVAGLAAELAKIGDTRITCRVDQVVPVHAQSPRTPRPTVLKISSDTPYTAGAVAGPAGQKSRVINRQRQGANFEIRARAAGVDGAATSLALEVDLSAIAPSRVTHSTGDDAEVVPIFLSANHVYTGLATGKPIVLLTLDNSGLDADSPATALITRIVATPGQ